MSHNSIGHGGCQDDDPEESTKALFRSIALERAGYYDSTPGGPPRLSYWQKRIRGVVFTMLDARLNQAPPLHRILDAGCGRGDFTLELAARYRTVEKIHGCDFSPEILELARAAATGQPRLRFSVGELTALPFEPEDVDLTLSLNVLHHIPPTRLPAALAELARVSKHTVILEIKNARSPYFRMHSQRVEGVPIFPTTVEEVRVELGAHGFELVKRSAIFGVEWLSPLIVMQFERKHGTMP